MFDIGFGELVLVFVIGLIVLGPQRLPVAVKTVAGWVRALRSLATTVQNELSQELKLQEFQDSLKKVEKASLDNLSPEFKASMDELREAAESMKRSYTANDPEKASDEEHTIHTPPPKDATPAEPIAHAESPASAPAEAPAPAHDASPSVAAPNKAPEELASAEPQAIPEPVTAGSSHADCPETVGHTSDKKS
ncbi:sec-independent protein translocase protein TatB [Salmonella enterica subsp. enterica serovar Choleraesuis]|nr:sec-independent protein translocase protein TatB [Salmonella enterica subsp. enterica serovar Choleraesuis]